MAKYENPNIWEQIAQARKDRAKEQNNDDSEKSMQEYTEKFLSKIQIIGDLPPPPEPDPIPDQSERERIYKFRLMEILNNFTQDSTGKDFELNQHTKPFLSAMMAYFMGHEQFEEYGAIVNRARLDKGLLIIGGYGIGKTTTLKGFRKLWELIPDHWPEKQNEFIMSSTMDLVNATDSEILSITRKNKNVCIDDLGREFAENNLKYGQSPIAGILHFRFNKIGKKLKFFATSNATGREISSWYGSAIFDRFKEHCNIIKLDGQSFRE